MTLKCPKCGRPNSGETAKCIYCGVELPAVEKAAPEKPRQDSSFLAEKLPGAIPAERKFLVLAPLGGEPGPDTVQSFARIMGWDNFSARVRLRSPAPSVLAGYDEAGQARELIDRFTEAGIKAYLVKESGLERLSKKRLALSAAAKEGGVVFRLEDGSEAEANFSELFLMARGRIRLGGEFKARVGEVELADMEMDREKTFDLLIKFRRDRKQRKSKIGDLEQAETRTEVGVLDLYMRSGHTAFRVIESEFDFSSLFGTAARLIGFKKLAELLRNSAPQLIVDDTFNKTSYVFREKPVDKKFSPALSRSAKTKSREKLHSSQALFTEHSGLIYLEALRKRVAEKK